MRAIAFYEMRCDEKWRWEGRYIR